MAHRPRNSRHLQRLARQVRATEPLCARCGQPWDPTAPWWTDRAFTLGHIIPWSQGGPDTRDNVRAEHRACNRNASDRTTRITPSEQW